MINAGILTVLFIAAMSMREDTGERAASNAVEKSDPAPLFKEMVEIPPVALAVAPLEPAHFTLPPIAEVVEKAPEVPAVAPPPVALAVDEVLVEKGDNLDKLAKKYKTSVDEIIKLNQLPSSFLKVGQRLKMPPQKSPVARATKSPAPLAPVETQAEYYTMKVGDNPWSIAMKHHLKVDELLKMNGLNDKSARKLKPGDRLRIR
jgi:LysM repeat protein